MRNVIIIPFFLFFLKSSVGWSVDCGTPDAGSAQGLNLLNSKLKNMMQEIAGQNTSFQRTVIHRSLQIIPSVSNSADNYCLLHFKSSDAKKYETLYHTNGDAEVLSPDAIWDEICDVPDSYPCPVSVPKPNPTSTCRSEKFEVKRASEFELSSEFLSFPAVYFWYTPPKQISRVHQAVISSVRNWLKNRLESWAQPSATTPAPGSLLPLPSLQPYQPKEPQSIWSQLSLQHLTLHASYSFKHWP